MYLLNGILWFGNPFQLLRKLPNVPNQSFPANVERPDFERHFMQISQLDGLSFEILGKGGLLLGEVLFGGLEEVEVIVFIVLAVLDMGHEFLGESDEEDADVFDDVVCIEIVG